MKSSTTKKFRVRSENRENSDRDNYERDRRLRVARMNEYHAYERAMQEQEMREYGNKVFSGQLSKLTAKNKNGESFALDAVEGVENIISQFKPDLQWAVLSKFKQTFIGWQNCAILMQNAIISNAVTLPPQKAMSVGYKLAYADEKKSYNQDKLDKMERLSDAKYNIRELCIKAAINSREYGYSLTIPTFNKDVDMSKPFNIEKIERGSYTGLATIEPYWVVPQLAQSELIEPWTKNFFEPTSYLIGGVKKVHSSWCIKDIPYPVGDVLKPAYFYGGVPLVQMIFEDVFAYEKACGELLQLLLTKRTACIEGDMMGAMMNPDEFHSKMRMSSATKDNYGLLAVDLDSNVKQFDTTLTGVSEIVETMQNRICAKTQMSPADLFKQVIRGASNGAGKFERSDVNNNLERIQNTQYKPIINFHNMLMTKSEYGKVIPLEVVFNPIDSPDELTRAQIRDYDMKAAMMRVGAHLTTREEERAHLASAPNGDWLNLNPNLPEELKEAMEGQGVGSAEIDKDFSTEKDNQGRPTPKPINDLHRGRTKDDMKRIEENNAEQE